MSEDILFSQATLQNFMQEIIQNVEQKTSIHFDSEHIKITKGENKGRTLGTCYRNKNYCTQKYEYKIVIYKKHSLTEEEVKGVITHELIHTLPNCMRHNSLFHYNGLVIKNECGYDYGGRTTNLGEDFKLSNYKYFTYCPCCKKIHNSTNVRGKRIQHPEYYSCRTCNTLIKSATKEEMIKILNEWKKEDM